MSNFAGNHEDFGVRVSIEEIQAEIRDSEERIGEMRREIEYLESQINSAARTINELKVYHINEPKRGRDFDVRSYSSNFDHVGRGMTEALNAIEPDETWTGGETRTSGPLTARRWGRRIVVTEQRWSVASGRWTDHYYYRIAKGVDVLDIQGGLAYALGEGGPCFVALAAAHPTAL